MIDLSLSSTAALSFIAVIIYISVMSYFSNKYNQILQKLKINRLKKIKNKQFKDFETINKELNIKIKEYRKKGIVLISITAFLHTTLEIVINKFRILESFTPIVVYVIFLLIFLGVFWLKGASTLDKNMRLPGGWRT